MVFNCEMELLHLLIKRSLSIDSQDILIFFEKSYYDGIYPNKLHCFAKKKKKKKKRKYQSVFRSQRLD